MSNIEIGQVWKNHLGLEMTITSPGYPRLNVLSDDIWIAEWRDPLFSWSEYAVTEKSLTEGGYVLDRKETPDA